MTLSVAFDLNPADTQQALILMDEGTIVAQGGAIDPHVSFNWTPGYGCDLQVTDWTTPSGYALETLGSIPAFGSATPITQPETADYTPGFPIHRALAMNPAADATGYVLRCDGEIKAASTMTGLDLQPSILWPGQDLARDVAVKWDTSGTVPRLSWYILDAYGGLTKSSGAKAGTPAPDAFYSPGRDIARRLMVVDWETPVVYWVDIYGGVHRFWTSCPLPANSPQWQGYGPVKDIKLVSQSPFVYDLLDWNLTVHPVVASTPPTVTITAPADSGTVTTTRPAVNWAVSDAQNDRIASVTARLFSAAQYGISGFDPTTSPCTFEATVTDMSTLGAVPDVAVPNGSWRWYVWAVEALTGYRSDIVHVTFTVSVTAPATPTVVATPDPNIPVAHLTITATPPPVGSVFVIQASIDGGVTWQSVTGGSAVPAASSVTFDDVTVPTHTLVQYRARIWRPDVQIDGAWSAAASVRVDLDGYWLSTIDDPAVSVSVQEIQPATRRTAGVFDPIGRRNAVVVTDVAKGDKGTVKFGVYSTPDRTALEALLDTQPPLLLRDHFGKVMWFAVTGDVTREVLRAEPEPGDPRPMRDAQQLTVPFSEIDPPT